MIVDDLFDTEQKRASALSAFASLRFHPGWELIQRIQDKNIEFLREQLEIGLGTKEEDDRVRDKIKLLRELRDAADTHIKNLQPQEQNAVNLDPYESVDELQQRKKILEQKS